MNGDVGEQSSGELCVPVSDGVSIHATDVNEVDIDDSQVAKGSSEVDSGDQKDLSKMDTQENTSGISDSTELDKDSGNQECNIDVTDSSQPLESCFDEEKVNRISEEGSVESFDGAQDEELVGNSDTGQAASKSIEKDADQLHTSVSESVDPKSLNRDQVKQLISQQIEVFFSREHWSSDSYLVSQLDSDQYVPLHILANFSQFRSITEDYAIILEALRESLFVQLDEENKKVRPNYSRCIVLLREIPESTPVKDVEAIFEGEGCPRAISCEFIHNNVWYVTFESDSDAQKAYRYVLETVQTFNHNPIRARMKSKTFSRMGCLSVLPSCGQKPPPAAGEQRENPVAHPSVGQSSAPCLTPMGPSGMMGVPTQPPHPQSAYPLGNPQRLYFPPNQINSYNYASYPTSQVPTAYFCPNPMMQWSTQNFYDINSLIQYNGLSPRAAYKPNMRFNSNNTNGNRRTKNRDPKYDKTDPRYINMVPNNVSGRQQSSQSPHPIISQPGYPNMNLRHSYSSQPPSVAENGSQKSSRSGCSTPNGSGPVPFAHQPSQSNAYSTSSSSSTSTSTSAANVTSKMEKKEKTEPVINTSSLVSSNCIDTLSSSDGDSSHNPSSSSTQPQSHSSNLSVPLSGRNNDGHRDSQAQRQMSRGGGRKRLPRRDEDNGRANMQKGSGQPNCNVASRAPYSEPRKPQFELQPNLFPPLPCADEIATYVPEEKDQQPPQTPWSGESHKFSDVMKGTAKLKQPNVSSASEKESAWEETPEAADSGESQSSSSCASQPVNQEAITPAPGCTNGNVKSCVPLEDAHSMTGGHDRPTQVREQRSFPREERRGPITRREKEFIHGTGRGSLRGRGDGMNFRLPGNKENSRPQNKPWREERTGADADGWITKSPRETRSSRDSRYQQQQHVYFDNNRMNSGNTKALPSTTVLLNGDSSPPASPKRECESIPMNTKNTMCLTEKQEESTDNKEQPAMNNNEGECKPTWAKMALASKDQMERLSAELKEKAEQEKLKKSRSNKPSVKLSEKAPVGREREGKPFRRETVTPKEKEKDTLGGDRPPREFSGRTSFGFRNKDPNPPKSPK